METYTYLLNKHTKHPYTQDIYTHTLNSKRSNGKKENEVERTDIRGRKKNTLLANCDWMETQTKQKTQKRKLNEMKGYFRIAYSNITI